MGREARGVERGNGKIVDETHKNAINEGTLSDPGTPTQCHQERAQPAVRDARVSAGK